MTYALLLGLTVVMTLAVAAFVAVRIRTRRTAAALAAALTLFAMAHAVLAGRIAVGLGPSWDGPAFVSFVLAHAALAAFAILHFRNDVQGRVLRPLVGVVLLGVGLAAHGAYAGRRVADAFEPAVELGAIALSAYLVGCLAIAIAESYAAWRTAPSRRESAFLVFTGSIVLVIGGPVYAFQLVALGIPELTGTNLAVPIAGALFGLALARENPTLFRTHPPTIPRRIPWTVPGGAYLIAETRPKYAEAMFLAAAFESPALAIVSDAPTHTSDLTGVETVQLPPGRRCAPMLAATASEFLARRSAGVVLVHDVSYAVVHSGLPATVDAVARVARAMPPPARLVVSLSKLTEDERAAFRSVRATWVVAPDVEAQLAGILRTRLGAAKDPLARGAVARGKRVEDLTIPDIPHLRDYLFASLADLRSPADDAARAGWDGVSTALAADLDALWRTPPTAHPSRSAFAAAKVSGDFTVVRANDVLDPTVGEGKGASSAHPLGAAVREAFLGLLGPVGETVFAGVVARLRKDPSAIAPEDLPRVADLAEEALQDLRAAIDLADAGRDLQDRTRRLRARLEGLARGAR